jgi:hypothetical protein
MSVFGRPRPARRPAGRRETLLSRLWIGLLDLLYLRPPARRSCPECAVDFAPSLTDDRCPICSWLATETPRAVHRGHRREPAGLGIAWVLGLVIFLLFVHALYV